MEHQIENSLVVFLEATGMVAAGLIGFIGVIIMTYGTVKGLGMFMMNVRHKRKLLIEIRIEVAKHLSLGLEFLVGKDIIETIVSPTMERIVTLAAIVALRTAIGIILGWEMRGASREIEQEKTIDVAIAAYEKDRLK
jgi:uncharacterized membrane protein